MIIIADAHLGKTNDSFVKDGVLSQTWDVEQRLNSILARAKITHQCIVLAGDIWHRMNPTTQALSIFFKWLNKCRIAGVRVIVIAGNHDSGVDWTSTYMLYDVNLPNVEVVTQAQVVNVYDTEQGFHRPCLLWPHMPAAHRELAEQGHGNVSRAVAAQFPTAEFIITHGQVFEGYSNDIFFEAGEAMKIEPLEFKSLQLMVLGHVHNHSSGDKWVYPGSLTINNFGEVDEEKGWIEVDLKTLKYEWYPFSDDVTPWVHLDIDLTEKDETAIDEDAVAELVTGAVVKVVVYAKAHGVINELYIRQLINKYGYVSRFETVVETSQMSLSEAEDVSHEDLLVEYLSTNKDVTEEEREDAIKMGKRILSEVNV